MGERMSKEGQLERNRLVGRSVLSIIYIIVI